MKWVLVVLGVTVLLAIVLLWSAVSFDASPLQKEWKYSVAEFQNVYVYAQAWGLGGGTVKFVISCKELSSEEVRSPQTEGVAHIYDATSIFVRKEGEYLTFSTASSVVDRLAGKCRDGLVLKEGQADPGPGQWEVLNVYEE